MFSLGVYYYCYEAVKAIFEKAKGQGKPMSTAESMLAGALAGSAVVFATNPIWTVNVSFFYIKMKWGRGKENRREVELKSAGLD